MLVFNDTRMMIIFVMSFITVGNLAQNLMVKHIRQLTLCFTLVTNL